MLTSGYSRPPPPPKPSTTHLLASDATHQATSLSPMGPIPGPHLASTPASPPMQPLNALLGMAFELYQPLSVSSEAMPSPYSTGQPDAHDYEAEIADMEQDGPHTLESQTGKRSADTLTPLAPRRRLANLSRTQEILAEAIVAFHGCFVNLDRADSSTPQTVEIQASGFLGKITALAHVVLSDLQWERDAHPVNHVAMLNAGMTYH
ncbi:hypothetical protein M0805_006230 [Coniferiporia weirii]|nr:hypothetical protein M0805_006230 [Coniferiporia weirii]